MEDVDDERGCGPDGDYGCDCGCADVVNFSLLELEGCDGTVVRN